MGIGVALKSKSVTVKTSQKVLGSTAFDAATTAFIDAVEAAGGSLTTAEQDALDIYVLDAKNNVFGWWTDAIADYPFLGSSAAAHAINLKTPGTFDLTFVNTVAGDHTSNGWKPNGTNSLARTNINASTDMVETSGCFEYYSLDNVEINGAGMGCSDGVTATQLLNRFATNNTHFDYHFAAGRQSASNSDSSGAITGSRVGTSIAVYRNGVSLGGGTSTPPSAPALEIYLGARNLSGASNLFVTWETAGIGIFGGLTAPQVSAQYNGRQTLNIALSRQV